MRRLFVRWWRLLRARKRLLLTLRGSKKFNDLSEDDITFDVLNAIYDAFHNLCGLNCLIVTLGSKGVFFSSNDYKARDIIKGVKVDKVIDTTAAGDTFVGYFAATLARHIATKGKDNDDFDVSAAVKRANAAAAICVQRNGAMQSIPYGYEVA